MLLVRLGTLWLVTCAAFFLGGLQQLRPQLVWLMLFFGSSVFHPCIFDQQFLTVYVDAFGAFRVATDQVDGWNPPGGYGLNFVMLFVLALVFSGFSFSLLLFLVKPQYGAAHNGFPSRGVLSFPDGFCQ